MNTEIIGIVAQVVLMVVLSYPLGKYIARVYQGKKVWTDFMKPIEGWIFRLSGIHPDEEMNWKQFLRALLTVNLFWFIWGMVLLTLQGWLPLNPDGNLAQSAHQAFNTCIYIARVYQGKKVWTDFMKPIEGWIFRLSGIHPDEEMNWKQFLRALLTVNLFWFIWGMVLLTLQGWLPLNPDGNLAQSAHQAFNTCISFMVNCNEQHYSGESNLTYFTQLFVIMLFQFLTAATGMAAMAGVMKALGEKTTQTIGNFWNFLVLSCTRILLPLSLVVGFILITQGIPMGFDGKMEVTTLEGETQYVSQGPAAAIIPIKQLGTNGGGYFGVNSSHPLENPTYLSNMIECWSILIIPMAMAFAFGFYVNRKKLGYSIYGVMLVAFLIGVCVNVSQEMGGNPRIDAMGIAQDNGSMEGKEIRLGSGATGLWSVVTTVTSNGSVNGMHDSTLPLSGMIEMLNMQINTWFGGVGVGWMNYFTFLIIAVFISGLMVGRTPEFMGMGITQDNGSMEGKEIRLGSGATGLWSVVTTVTSNGSVNGMHDSTLPLSGIIEMLNMQINTWFGGVGVGWMNYFTLLIIAVFIRGLLVGRTPEFMGHMVEAR